MSGNLEADRRDSLLDEMARWRDRAIIAEARLDLVLSISRSSQSDDDDEAP